MLFVSVFRRHERQAVREPNPSDFSKIMVGTYFNRASLKRREAERQRGRETEKERERERLCSEVRDCGQVLFTYVLKYSLKQMW